MICPRNADLLTRTSIREAKLLRNRESEEIDIDPTSVESVSLSDDELSESIRKTVASMNEHLRSDKQEIAVWHHAAISIAAGHQTMHCTRNELALFGKPCLIDGVCLLAGIPLDFSYSGPPKDETKALRILRTFR